MIQSETCERETLFKGEKNSFHPLKVLKHREKNIMSRGGLMHFPKSISTMTPHVPFYRRLAHVSTDTFGVLFQILPENS